MGYATQETLLRRIGTIELAKLASTGEDLIETLADADAVLLDPDAMAVVQQAIDDAYYEMNGYIVGHLDITDSANIAALERHNAYLALHALYAKAQNSSRENPYTEYRTQCLDWLTNVARGRFHTQTDDDVPISSMLSTTSDSTKKFGLASDGTNPLTGFI